MATIAIGDIHGNRPALDDVLDALGPEVTEGDAVVFLGDYIDRGPDSRGCIDAILSFRDQTPAEVVCLRGNHEEWLLRTQQDYSRHSWLLGMEGLTTVGSYSAEAEQLLREALAANGLQTYLRKCPLPYETFFDAVPTAHLAFLAQLVLGIETADCVCVHAGVDPRVAHLRDQPRGALVWGHDGFPDDYAGDVPVVYGHSNNAVLDERGWPHPRIVGNTIGIDTIAHGVLTAIRMPERRVVQSRQHAKRAHT